MRGIISEALVVCLEAAPPMVKKPSELLGASNGVGRAGAIATKFRRFSWPSVPAGRVIEIMFPVTTILPALVQLTVLEL